MILGQKSCYCTFRCTFAHSCGCVVDGGNAMAAIIIIIIIVINDLASLSISIRFQIYTDSEIIVLTRWGSLNPSSQYNA